MADDGRRTCHFLVLFLLPFIVISQENQVDVAPGGEAWQSSEVLNGGASLAIDGDEATCSETKIDSYQPWWVVDLRKQHTVLGVQVTARKERSVDAFRVYVGNSENVDEHSFCAKYMVTNPEVKVSLTCHKPLQGQYVSVKGNSGARIYMCDFKVFECVLGYFGKKCTNKCHCEDNYSCHKVDGTCTQGQCEAGYHGNSCQTTCTPGTYGPSCLRKCHCLHGEICDRIKGTCPNNVCEKGWVGTQCEINLPRLKEMPGVEPRTRTYDSLTVLFKQWKQNVNVGNRRPDYYLIQYKTRSVNGDSRWMDGPSVINKGGVEQRVKVTGLKLNTRYFFRVIPVVKEYPTVMDNQIPTSFLVKTRCLEPEAPVIENVGTDAYEEGTDASAMVMVSWKGPDSEQVHCDNVKFYMILYKQKSAQQWEKPVYVINSVRSHNLTKLQFATAYQVSVVAVNNEDLKNESAASDITTVASPIAGAAVDSVTQSNSAIVAGVVIVIILVLVASGVALFLRRKYTRVYKSLPTKPDKAAEVKYNNKLQDKDAEKGVRHSSEPPSVKPPPKPPREKPISETDTLPLEEYDEIRDSSSPSSEETPFLSERSPSKSHLIKVSDLEKYIAKLRENEEEGFKKEYKEIPFGLVHKCEVGKKPENKHKNRFVNIIPYDHSRVILDTFPEDPDSDYINANHVDAFQKPQAFIATQGVNKFTVSDLWRMVWQVKAKRIVMVTNLVENGKRKCEPYWPDEGSKQYGDIMVELLDTEPTSDFIVRSFKLSKAGDERVIKHLLFTSWPDHGVPTQAAPLIAFRKKVRGYDHPEDGPIVLHCSAGVGRTGTFIALDYLLDQAKVESQVDVYNCVQMMRKNRVNMIQTVEQYIFVYDALLEALTLGETGIACSEFAGEFEKITQALPGHIRSKLEEQYEMLQSTSPVLKPEDCSSALLPENEDKNRYRNILPANRYRPYLMTRVPGRTDYINAVFADGFKKRNAFLLTQMPMPNTVVDFWRMVYEHHSSTIVMLNDVDPMDPTCEVYWPKEVGGVEKVGRFEISLESLSECEGIRQREFKVSYDTEHAPVWQTAQEPHTVRQFQLLAWPHDDALPESAYVILRLLLAVQKWQHTTRNGPITVHCMNGATRSGLFSVVMCMVEKMKADQEVDVFQTVKQLRRHRPQIIEDLEQYHFCHQVALEYLGQLTDKNSSSNSTDLGNISDVTADLADLRCDLSNNSTDYSEIR